MANTKCPACKEEVEDIETHVAESHSDPDKKIGSETEADYIARLLKDPKSEEVFTEAKSTEVPVFDVLAELGVKEDDLGTAKVSTLAGPVCSPTEAKMVMEAVGTFAGFVYDRPSFIVNFIDWGIRTSFSEELSEAGGFTIESDPSQPVREKFAKVSSLHSHIVEYLGSQGVGRSFTFRRMGRYLARIIEKTVERNKALKNYYVTGSPMSNRLGIPPVDFLTATSIFEYIKPYQKWTDSERRAWHAHNRSVTKLANVSNNDFLPTDLRPSPSQAETAVDHGENDFGGRHARHVSSTYGIGKTMFDRMIDETEKKRVSRQGLGHGS